MNFEKSLKLNGKKIDWKHISKDKELDGVRNTAAFKKIVAKYKK